MAEVVRLPHGYGNGTCIVEGTVEKRHQGPVRHEAAALEADVLQCIANFLPVPKVLQFDPTEPLLRLELIEGVNGQALVERGLTCEVLFQCGVLLGQIASVDTSSLPFLAKEEHLVHGDYGPHNLLFSSNGTEVRGIVDWEFARGGNPIEDLAWAEWIIRMHHPDQMEAIPALFEGYGSEPYWDERHSLMLHNCKRTLKRAKARGNEKTIKRWYDRSEQTQQFKCTT